jgi:hypothetical protein
VSPGLLMMALVLGAGALALWFDVRFPKLAPHGLVTRLVSAAAATVALAALPVSATVLSLVGVFVPAMAVMFLTSLWLLRLVAEPGSHV